jgi:hypothetical protein
MGWGDFLKATPLMAGLVIVLLTVGSPHDPNVFGFALLGYFLFGLGIFIETSESFGGGAFIIALICVAILWFITIFL